MRVGVFGGTFDPPHLGHVQLAKSCIRELGLDEVIFLPAGRNPTKKRRPIASGRDRLEMVKRAVQDQVQMAVSDIELTRGGPSFTVDTMAELSFALHADYWFLVGTDAAKLLPQWKDPHRLLQLCRIAVVKRNGESFDPAIRMPRDMRDRIDVVNMSPCEASSTQIRDLLAQDRDVSRFMSPAVLDYIKDRKLYPTE